MSCLQCSNYNVIQLFESFCSSLITQSLSLFPIQDYCITLTTPNSTQINTSRQCMFKSIHVTTDWHLAHRFMVHTKSSIFVSNIVTLCVRWLVSTSKLITCCIWLPQIEFMPTCFYSLIFHLCMWLYLIFAIYICGSILFLVMLILLAHFRVSLVVGVHSIWAHGGGESFFGTFMCVFD